MTAVETAETAETVTTKGGMRIVPDLARTGLNPSDSAMRMPDRGYRPAAQPGPPGGSNTRRGHDMIA